MSQVSDVKHISDVDTLVTESLGGQYSCTAVQVLGTINSGHLVIKGFVVEEQGVTLSTENVAHSIRLEDNEIVAPGIYRVSTTALQLVGVESSSDFDGDVTVVFSSSGGVPPIFVT